MARPCPKVSCSNFDEKSTPDQNFAVSHICNLLSRPELDVNTKK